MDDHTQTHNFLHETQTTLHQRTNHYIYIDIHMYIYKSDMISYLPMNKSLSIHTRVCTCVYMHMYTDVYTPCVHLHIYTCVYMHIYTDVCMCAYLMVLAYICIHVQIYANIIKYAHMHTHVQVIKHMSFIHVSICRYVRMCVHAYMYTCTQTPSNMHTCTPMYSALNIFTSIYVYIWRYVHLMCMSIYELYIYISLYIYECASSYLFLHVQICTTTYLWVHVYVCI